MSSELFHYLLYFRNKKAQKVFFSIHSKSFFPSCIPWSILNAISYSKIKAHFGAFCWAILFKSINLSFLKSDMTYRILCLLQVMNYWKRQVGFSKRNIGTSPGCPNHWPIGTGYIKHNTMALKHSITNGINFNRRIIPNNIVE